MMNSKLGDWEHISSERGPNIGPLQTRFDNLKNPRNNKDVKILVIEGRDAVNAVAITKEQEIILVRQLRFGTGEMSIELPGGLMDEGETQLEAVKRELREETGFTGVRWRYLSTVASNPVFMNNYIHTWIASGVELTHPTEMDEAEDIEIFKVKAPELKKMLLNGEFSHPHAVSAVTSFLINQGFLK